MLGQLLPVFVDVVAPVFAIVGLGWLLGPRLVLEARTLSRAAYWIFVPAFTFRVIASAELPLARAGRMGAFVLATHLAFVAMGWGVARLLRRSREVTAAYIMLAVFGNVGNYGLALLEFRLGKAALVPATIYFILSLLISFTVCVGAAAWVRGGHLSAIGQVLRTPALAAAGIAVVVSATGVEVPIAASRSIGLLADAMIPIMLVTLGLQLAAAEGLRLTKDAFVASALRLVASPLVALALAGPFALPGVDRAAAVLQAAMPAAVLVAIIANEHDVAPGFVMSTVFFSTLCSVPVLTVLLALV